MAALRESGSVPGDENGVKPKRAAGVEDGGKKKKRVDKSVSFVYFPFLNFCYLFLSVDSSEWIDGLINKIGRYGQTCRWPSETWGRRPVASSADGS